MVLRTSFLFDLFAVVAVLPLVAGCSREVKMTGPNAIALLPLVNAGAAGNSADKEPRIQWKFDAPSGDSATLGWEAVGGVNNLAVADGCLVGATTEANPVLRAQLPQSAGLVYLVEVKASITSGRALGVAIQPSPEARRVAMESTPIRAGEQVQSYLIQLSRPAEVRGACWIYLKPADVAGAQFKISSVRLLTLEEYLANSSSEVGRFGFNGDFKNSIAMKTPSSLQFNVDLQERPWLDVSLGAMGGAVIFNVLVAGVNDAANKKTLQEQTVGEEESWKTTRVDLSEYAGEKAEITLEANSASPGAIAFLGSPVVRTSRAPAAVLKKEQAPPPPQGVVVIAVDGLRRDSLDSMPALTGMASKGAVLQDCISQANSSETSVSSILTSMYPTSHGAYAERRLSDDVETIAEIYTKAGYATLAIFAGSGGDAAQNLYQGFEEFDETDYSVEVGQDSYFFIADLLEEWLVVHKDVPFFVFIHFSDPSLKGVDKGLSAIDVQVGRYLKHLASAGLQEKTAVAIVGTYGSELDEHGRAYGDSNIYAEISNVPMLIASPGIAAGKAYPDTVQAIDLMPTLLEMSGLAFPEAGQGQSFYGLLTGGSFGKRPAVIENSRGSVAIMRDGFKLVHHKQPMNGQSEFELFDRANDPFDKANVAAAHADVVEDLKKELDGWRERVHAAEESAPASPETQTPEKLEQLKSLGYF